MYQEPTNTRKHNIQHTTINEKSQLEKQKEQPSNTVSNKNIRRNKIVH